MPNDPTAIGRGGVIRPAVAFIMAVAGVLLAACSATPGHFETRMRPLEDGYWEITFLTPRPVQTISMVRVPDDSRLRRWRSASPDIELVHEAGQDLIRHQDGLPFSAARFEVPASYLPLPKEYAPFSPFTDGGLLIHSGRFHACPGPVSEEKCAGPWVFRLTPPPGAALTVPGTTSRRQSTFASRDDGFMIYVGKARPVASEYFLGIVDPGLPEQTQALMQAVMPRLMAWYAQRLPPPENKPQLFMSFDPDYGSGYGRQGGTLPGQVFMHFYGSPPPQSSLAHAASDDVTWFFAHEVGHIFQRQVFGRLEDSWIHEGAAEAFAYLALLDLQLTSVTYLEERLASAADSCAESLARRPLISAAAGGDFAAHYACGLIMALAIHDDIVTRARQPDGLFALWAAMTSTDADLRDLTSDRMLGMLSDWTDQEVVDMLSVLISEPLDAPQSFLRQLRSGAAMEP